MGPFTVERNVNKRKGAVLNHNIKLTVVHTMVMTDCSTHCTTVIIW